MVDVVFVESDGNRIEADLAMGSTLMEGARRIGINGIVAECGGQSACATCVVLVTGNWGAVLPPAGDLELAMLEMSDHFCDRARLSCQIVIDDRLNGMVVDVPASQ